jgi:hypothetical protein
LLIRDGERVLGFLETEQAGLPKHYTESASTVYQRHMVSTSRAARYFGRRSHVMEPTGPNEG